MSGIPAGAGQLLGKRLGKFEILALLALGGTAEIYLARIGGAAGFEKYVVVKCLHDHLADDAEFVKMFLDEARLAAHLDHSNIVQTMELGQHDGRYYMVMEFLAGLSLAMIIRRAGERLPSGRLPTPLVLNVLAQSCAGLHYAHEKAMNGKALNIVHRDISPQNLVVSFEGVVKVVDFGIAKAAKQVHYTIAGETKGTPSMMAPEQRVGEQVDVRADVYSVAAVGYELVTGHAVNLDLAALAHLGVQNWPHLPLPSTLRALPPELDAILLRAMAFERDQRPADCAAFEAQCAAVMKAYNLTASDKDIARWVEGELRQLGPAYAWPPPGLSRAPVA